jgi:polysaccharide deacetylase family protein (PEP-CTERM system associated)
MVASPPAMNQPSPDTPVNAFSVDVEDWYQVADFDAVVPFDTWDRYESRVHRNTEKILHLLAEFGVKGTFFVLTWNAERIPEIVRQIHAAGHEIASHGYGHALLTEMTPREFDEDIERALDALARCSVRQPVLGYRAPSFTVVERTRDWAFELLEKYGFSYDSSVFPVAFHPDYGIPDAPLEPYRATEGLYEFPISCIDVLGRRLPVGGGGYFRLLPYAWTRFGIETVNRVDRRPAIFYIHPWEIDPDQPRLPCGLLTRIRHYRNLHRTEDRLHRLLDDFRFGPVRQTLMHQAPAIVPDPFAEPLPYFW